MDNLFWIGFVGAALALIFAYLQKCKVMKCSEGDEKMVKIASSIRAGANAYLKQQYSTVAKVFAVVFVILLIIAFASKGQMLSRVTPFAFLTGGIWSMLAGLIGMKIATAANARTANAAHESLNHGLNVAFSSGTVMGFTVVGLGILDITLWFIGLRYIGKITDPTVLANIMVMNGMGASFMALFARVGGGIYTKAADVGADLVGKVEAGIPEDDPRNPATIADNVGDNVGDVAGMGADLYESYVGSILATFALSAAANYGWSGMLLPVALAVCGIICSLIGSFLIKTREDATQMSLLKSLRTGTYTAAALSAVLALPLSYLILGPEQHCWGVYVAILCGLVGGCALSALVDIGSHGSLVFSCSRLGLRVFGRCLVLKHAIEIVRAPVVVFACLALAVAAGFVVFLPLFGHERIVFLLQLIVFGVRMLRRCRLGRLIAFALLGLLVFRHDDLPRGVFRHATAQASCFPENTHV